MGTALAGSPKPSGQIEKEIAQFLNATSSFEQCVAADALFSNDDALYEKLMAHKDSSLAITAAWRFVTRLDPHFTDTNGTPTRTLTDDKRAWFIGFLEGRLGRRSPPVWRRTFEAQTLKWGAGGVPNDKLAPIRARRSKAVVGERSGNLLPTHSRREILRHP
jgi:hypothetical protein